MSCVFLYNIWCCFAQYRLCCVDTRTLGNDEKEWGFRSIVHYQEYVAFGMQSVLCKLLSILYYYIDMWVCIFINIYKHACVFVRLDLRCGDSTDIDIQVSVIVVQLSITVSIFLFYIGVLFNTIPILRSILKWSKFCIYFVYFVYQSLYDNILVTFCYLQHVYKKNQSIRIVHKFQRQGGYCLKTIFSINACVYTFIVCYFTLYIGVIINFHFRTDLPSFTFF
eukprot:TRINITY_DN8927_c1_g1_i1.p2 TRINITY_DN8927_c1_g1~~TRINITY_DN8927_c1_g1_i1.p2  ORF type:complete len:223 (+),score=-14.83 TRINITY_DN8927_c1_g1_i1:63-731(+)